MARWLTTPDGHALNVDNVFAIIKERWPGTDQFALTAMSNHRPAVCLSVGIFDTEAAADDWLDANTSP